MARGKLIVVEGLDGSGISTQTEYLRTWCQKSSIPVAVTKEPTDGPAGGVIKWALRGDLQGLPEETLALLFAADRQHHLDREILPALNSGTTVICDRYSLSSFAYQLFRVGDLDWLRQLNAKAPPPDLTIFLDVSPSDCLKRMTSDAWRGHDKLQHYEELSALRAIYDNFMSIIPVLQNEGQRIVIIDGARDIQTVGEDIIREARKILNGSRGGRRAGPGSESHQISAILESRAVANS